jgi:hypothetical protein
MDEFSPMVEVIGIRWHCARPETSHKSASNQLQILRTHYPKNGRLRLVKRSKSNCKEKTRNSYIDQNLLHGQDISLCEGNGQRR